MTSSPDPHGQAALMLIESLLLLLLEKGIIEVEQATEAIDGIIDIKREMAGKSESVVVSIMSIGLLQAVSNSLRAALSPGGSLLT